MSYVGAATNVIGGILQAVAAKEAQKRMYQTYLSQLTKQRGFQGQMFGDFSSQAPGIYSVEAANNTLGQGGQDRQLRYQQIQDNPALVGAALPTQQAQTANNMASNRSATYAAYGDLAPTQSIRESKLGDLLKRTGFRSQGAAQVFPLQMQHSQHSMDWLTLLGQMISSIGGAAGNYQQFNQTPTGMGGDVPAAQTQGAMNEYLYGMSQ